MHIVLLKQFLNVINPPADKNKSSGDGAASKVTDDDEEDHLVVAACKNVENKELVWPELIRLVLQSKKKLNFNPLDE